MPRPKRARRAPTTSIRKSPEAERDEEEHRGRARGRTRATRSTGARMSLDEADAARSANRAHGTALGRLADEDPTVDVDGGPEYTMSSVEIGRRIVNTPTMRTMRRDTTGFDLADDDVFGNLGDSFADGEIPDPPRSAASSAGTFNHFKMRTRPRQSSIIGRNDAPIRPSSRGGNTPGVSSSFNIGAFRRRPREPSILATSRRARSRTGSLAGSVASSRASSIGLDHGLESEDDLAPEAESTPTNSKRASRQLGRRSRSTTRMGRSGRGRSDDAVDPVNAKARRGGADSEMDMISDSEPSEAPSPSPPPARLGRPVTPVNMDEIHAPPASSDSEADEAIWPDIHQLAKKRRRLSITTPIRKDGNMSDSSTSSPPSLTHSPNLAPARGRGAGRKQPSPKVTTADLASLLPKRTYKRNRDELEIDSASEADFSTQEGHQDEPRSRSRGRKESRPTSRGTLRPASRARHSRANAAVRAKPTRSAVRRSARTAGKTYQRSDDKENESGDEDENDDSQFQPLPDDTFDTSVVERSLQNAEELKRASKKFEEVDQWELSFEEVAEPPSPQGAR